MREHTVRLVADLVATVEIDGFAMGSTPCTIRLRRGAHKIRLSCPGFFDYTANINVTADGMSLDVPMRMAEDGQRRWQELLLFVNSLSKDRKLLDAMLINDGIITDANADYIRGLADMYRNSHFRFTKFPDITVNETNVFRGDTHRRRLLMFLNEYL